MGLDIIVLNNLNKTTPDYPYRYPLYNLPGFEMRCTNFEEGFYQADCIYSFSAGKYAGYNLYRWGLAKLAGYCRDKAWKEPDKFKEQDFFEQIDFPDNEGALDYNVAEQLYQDYSKYELQAKSQMEDWHFELYCSFKEAFQLAYEERGVVVFN